MKIHTIGVFIAREDAEKAINYIHNKLSVPNEEISYLYRNSEGEVREVEAGKISSKTPGEGAKTGAKAGAALGGIAGLAIAAGTIPVIGPLVAAGPLMAALGITGALGTVGAGAIGGAAVGGLVGALANIGIGKEKAKRYEDQVLAGNILVAVHTNEGMDVAQAMMDHNAVEVETFGVSV